MNNTVCLSFSDTGFQLLNIISDDNEINIVSNHQFNFPSPKSYDQIFNTTNILFVIDSLIQFKKENNGEDFSLSFALPFNFADIKKVAFPSDSEKMQKKRQIEWELKTTLPGELSEYKISVLNEISEPSFSSAIVVAIRKILLEQLYDIAVKTNSKVRSVLLSCFAVENYIAKNNMFDQKKNFVFLKINKNIIEHHFFNGRDYFLSQIDSLDISTRSKEEIILELSHERYKNISNIFSQTTNDNPFELYLYGDYADENIFKTLKNGLSIPVEYPLIDNFPNSEGYKYIEAWGCFI